jgi:hypothetical protein
MKMVKKSLTKKKLMMSQTLTLIRLMRAQMTRLRDILTRKKLSLITSNLLLPESSLMMIRKTKTKTTHLMMKVRKTSTKRRLMTSIILTLVKPMRVQMTRLRGSLTKKSQSLTTSNHL